ncbi:MAG: DUF1080 domain-containing protein, partial [Sedimentisphaerales bacterium]
MRITLHTILLFGVLLVGACHPSGPKAASSESGTAPSGPATPSAQGRPQAAIEDATPTPAEISLFDGKTLGHWKITDFGGQGKVYVKDGSLILETGNDMTGVTWDGPVVRMNYEITLDAMRISGSDFFCGLTFPVDANHCSLILGGWGGTLCGLSNIDYYDAANNETTQFMSFENGRWYQVRLRVTPGRIQACLVNDEEPLVDMDIKGRKIDT